MGKVGSILSEIFISYASEDRQRIRPLAHALEARGWSVFWDPNIPTGKSWREVLDHELKDARCIVVAWSDQSIVSRWVHEEAEDGRERAILIPVFIDKVLPPLGFRSVQAADLSEWDHTKHSDVLERLLADIDALLGAIHGETSEADQASRVAVEDGGAKEADPADTDRLAEPLALPEKPSIAVLPFTNMSGDPEQEYFSDGISEDIITALSKNHWLFVIARNSTFTYKGSAVDVTRVSRELGVQYVLEGSVRKAANKVRITAQLVDGTTGNHVWADRYDRELDDIFAVQDEITETIVGRLDTALRVSEMDRARRKPPANLDAWELYQRGQWHVYKLTKEDNEAARTLFLKAVERDPNFACPHAGFAFTCFREVYYGFGDNPVECLAKGLAAGEHAVALDDKDGFTHFVLGRVLALAGQGDRAIAELEKSVALYPSYAHGYNGLGITLNWYGRAADAIPKLDIAMRLSPHDPILWGTLSARASCCNNLENFDEAAEWARKSINTRADMFWPRLHLARALAEQDRLDEAGVAIEAARSVKHDLSLSVVRRLLPHYHREYLERLLDGLRKAGLPE
jgi:adenylate cyclase